jgi:hypothetical protein
VGTQNKSTRRKGHAYWGLKIIGFFQKQSSDTDLDPGRGGAENTSEGIEVEWGKRRKPIKLSFFKKVWATGSQSCQQLMK